RSTYGTPVICLLASHKQRSRPGGQPELITLITSPGKWEKFHGNILATPSAITGVLQCSDTCIVSGHEQFDFMDGVQACRSVVDVNQDVVHRKVSRYR